MTKHYSNWLISWILHEIYIILRNMWIFEEHRQQMYLEFLKSLPFYKIIVSGVETMEMASVLLQNYILFGLLKPLNFHSNTLIIPQSSTKSNVMGRNSQSTPNSNSSTNNHITSSLQLLKIIIIYYKFITIVTKNIFIN